MSTKTIRKTYPMNEGKLEVAVSISNQPQGVVVTTTVGKVIRHGGYKTVEHAVFQDFCRREIIAPKIARITQKILNSWQETADTFFKKYSEEIAKIYQIPV